MIAGSGSGIRTNIAIIGNRVTGPMQLTAGMAHGLTLHLEIRSNRIHNARANGISVLGNGNIGGLNTLEDCTIADNVITADKDGNTSLGITVGIDGSSQADQNMNIRRLTIRNNRIDIRDSPSATADTWIRLGNLAANVGGFDSQNDTITIEDNELHHGMATTGNRVSASRGQSKISNFVFKNNRVLGGRMIFRYLADGAAFSSNTVEAPFRLGAGNGNIFSQGNTYATFIPINADAEFVWRSTGDTYTGRRSGLDRPFTLNANAGKVQIAYLYDSIINSRSTGIKRAAVWTRGAGNPTVHVRNLSSSTAWTLGKYERTSGKITDESG